MTLHPSPKGKADRLVEISFEFVIVIIVIARVVPLLLHCSAVSVDGFRATNIIPPAVSCHCW